VWKFLAQLEIGAFGNSFHNAKWFVVTFLYQAFGGWTLCWWVIFFGHYKWWSATSLTNVKDLNSYYDSYAKITKVDICVAWIVNLHLCLLGCVCCLLACWSGCHMLLGGKGITKGCASWLQLLGLEERLCGIRAITST
jgi:hypothetical protein